MHSWWHQALVVRDNMIGCYFSVVTLHAFKVISVISDAYITSQTQDGSTFREVQPQKEFLLWF